uniref:Cap-specific mRNA (nucleoside-2'-O-)-methyltransferase 2 n=1 Tax=Tetranychus urticae TaxID=32264 RepID=T1KPV3_TETUR
MDYATNIDQLFDKRFTFNLKNLDTLENLDDFLTWPPWEFRCGSLFRHDLDCTRTLLDDKDLISWNKHTNRTDLTSFVLKEIQIITSFPVLDLESESKKDLNKVNSLFWCEAPGSFVNEVNYYIQSKHLGIKFNWIASTLNPYYEQVDLIKIALDSSNMWRGIVAFWQRLKVSMNKPVDMITEDSGINCVDSPEIQEELSFQLILHQSLASINCFKSNFLFIVKMSFLPFIASNLNGYWKYWNQLYRCSRNSRGIFHVYFKAVFRCDLLSQEWWQL